MFLFAFITKETLNNDIRIFSHNKSIYIELIKIIMDAIVSTDRERAVMINRFYFYYYIFTGGFFVSDLR